MREAVNKRPFVQFTFFMNLQHKIVAVELRQTTTSALEGFSQFAKHKTAIRIEVISDELQTSGRRCCLFRQKKCRGAHAYTEGARSRNIRGQRDIFLSSIANTFGEYKSSID